MSEQSAVTQRVGLTKARLAISRLRPLGDMKNVLVRACEISAHALGVDRVGIWFFDDARGCLRCDHWFPVVPEGPEPLLVKESPSYFAAVRDRRFIATADAQVDPLTAELLPYLKHYDVHSMLDAAIFREGKVVGIVCHERTGPVRPFRDEELQFAATVADLIAYFLELEARLLLHEQAHKLELELLQSQRIDGLGRFATGVVHDFGNLLSVLSVGLSALEKQQPFAPKDLEVFQMMRESVDQGRKLTQALMGLVRQGETTRSLVEVDALVMELSGLLPALVKAPWSVSFDVEPGLTLWAEPVQFVQVVTNLVGNARDAMPNGGTVLVRLKKHEAEQVRLEVVDTGVGIPPELLDEVMKPFFTTKGKGAGTGLGLPTVQHIVHHHGGTFELLSAPNEGTTARVLWPSGQPGAEPEEDPAPAH